jgi:glycogen(starch) synthase
VPRVLVLTPGELTRDPRGRRAAQAARAAGLEVTGLCVGASGERVPLEGVEVARVPGGRVSAGLRGVGLGGMERSRAPVRELRGLFRLARLAWSNLRLAARARRLGPVDVVHAHEVETLPAGFAIARRRGARLVYDAHEVYADQEPDAPRAYRAVARAIEASLARRAGSVVTVSPPIAEELQRSLRLPRAPIPWLNCPPRSEPAPPPPADGPLRAIYQGAMGPGRPVGDLLAAIERATDVRLTIRLMGANLDDLRDAVAARGLADRVAVADTVAPDRLVAALGGFHVGLVINRPVTRNDELVLPNKLFEYLMGGLAVVVPRLPGMADLVEASGIGVTYQPGRPDRLADALSALAADRAGLEGLRRRARQLAIERWNAEAQREALLAAWGVSGR